MDSFRESIVKQILTLIALGVILWVGFTYLNQQIGTPTVRSMTVGPNLSIDGNPVTEVFAFTYPQIIDGDSLRVANAAGEEFDLRLASLDAPELRQAFGTEAKQHLQNLMGSQEIIAWKIGTDRYDRLLVFLFIEQSDGQLFEINSQMIRDGFAWHYKQHSSNPVLDNIENDARTSRVGLWSDTVQPVPPWVFRQQ